MKGVTPTTVAILGTKEGGRIRQVTVTSIEQPEVKAIQHNISELCSRLSVSMTVPHYK